MNNFTNKPAEPCHSCRALHARNTLQVNKITQQEIDLREMRLAILKVKRLMGDIPELTGLYAAADHVYSRRGQSLRLDDENRLK